MVVARRAGRAHRDHASPACRPDRRGRRRRLRRRRPRRSAGTGSATTDGAGDVVARSNRLLVLQHLGIYQNDPALTQSSSSSQVATSIDRHNVTGTLRLMASLRATCTLAFRSLARSRRRDRPTHRGTRDSHDQQDGRDDQHDHHLDQREAAAGAGHQCDSSHVRSTRSSPRITHLWMYQYVTALGCSPTDGPSGRSLCSDESSLHPMQNGSVLPSSSVTMPATGEGGKRHPQRSGSDPSCRSATTHSCTKYCRRARYRDSRRTRRLQAPARAC